MSWVRRGDPPRVHECRLPERAVVLRPKGTFNMADGDVVHTDRVPDGEFGDLWRCDRCTRLWRIGNACDYCDPKPPEGLRSSQRGHPGVVHGSVKTAWRPATWWQRLRHG